MNAYPLLSSTCLTAVCFCRKSQVSSLKAAQVPNDNILSNSLNMRVYMEINASWGPINQVGWPFQKSKGIEERLDHPPHTLNFGHSSVSKFITEQEQLRDLLWERTWFRLTCKSQGQNLAQSLGTSVLDSPFQRLRETFLPKSTEPHIKYMVMTGNPQPPGGNNYIRTDFLRVR